MLKKAEIPGFILRQAQDEALRFQRLGPHGELVEPWACRGSAGSPWGHGLIVPSGSL